MEEEIFSTLFAGRISGFFFDWRNIRIVSDDRNCSPSVSHIVHYLKMSKRDTNFFFVDRDCCCAVLTSSPLANPNRAVFAVAYPSVLGQSCLPLHIWSGCRQH